MPLYEYECEACGRFELIQKFSDTPLSECPKCGRSVEKLLSAPAIQFKGTGWYVTDYARKSSGNGKTRESEAKTADSGKSESSTPTKSTSKDSSAKGSSPTK